MKSSKIRSHLHVFICLLASFTLAFSLMPSLALAEVSVKDDQTASAVRQIAEAVSQGNRLPDVKPQAITATELSTQAEGDIEVMVGLPSESNVKKDICTSLTYNDNLFAKKSTEYNDDLAYASVCLAAAAINSNEGGDNYKLKSKNIVSFLQQIGCNDVKTNDGYNYKPMQKSNIGTAIGYKDIVDRNDGSTYRLFVIGVRGSGYEEEWAVNMRVGTEGDAMGFREARDGVLGFIMPYIKEHTSSSPESGDSPKKVKIWGSGYCRGGSTANLVFGWLNKWVFERNGEKESSSIDIAYSDSYRKNHTVDCQTYSKAEERYTGAVTFDPQTYIDKEIQLTREDIYAYPVNCPFSADESDVKHHEPIMVGIHNLINPDDWFPQVVMDWWGFKRYGYTHDHDITGTYAKDGDLHKRDKQVLNPEDKVRKDAFNAMTAKLKKMDPDTAFNSSYFRQRYFSKAAALGNAIANAGIWLINRLNVLGKKKLEAPDIFQVSIDSKGEGNKFYSKGKELKYNQGAYYQEFLKFLLNSAKFPDDPAKARKFYVDNYQDAFMDLMRWVCGQPLVVREKFGKVASSKVKIAFEDMKRTGIRELSRSGPFDKMASVFLQVTTGTPLFYVGSAIWAVNSEDSLVVSELVQRTLKLVFDELNIPYDKKNQADIKRAAKAVAKLAYNYYDKEQAIAKFCFFHTLTLMKAGESIAQSHWPEQSLSWFKQCKPYDPSKKPKIEVQANLSTQDEAAEAAEHTIFAYFDDDPDVLYDGGTRENGEIIGQIPLSEKYEQEGISITSWNMYNYFDYVIDNPKSKIVFDDYAIQADDPAYIVLVPNYEKHSVKHVKLWLNAAMTGFDKDVLIGEFNVYSGGYYYIAYTALPEGISDEGFDVLYYGDNKNLINREGVALNGWVNAADNDDDMVGFLPDDFLGYEELPEGDTVDLFAVWYDPLVYGMTYHANRSSSDSYQVESAQISDDSTTLTIEGLDKGDAGLKNPGKKFVGWNTKPDGSGESFATGDKATLTRLGLGTRAQYAYYLEELSKLELLDMEEEPIHYIGDTPERETAADLYGAALASKYTVHLYAQWADEPVKGTIEKIANVKGAKAKITAKKVSGAKKYQARYKVGKAKKWKTVKAKKSNAFTVKVKKGAKVTAQVRVMNAAGWGAWSKSKSLKTDKE